MRIYVDIDDVLCETAATLCGLAEREFGRHVKYLDVRQFDLQKVFSLDDSEMARFRELSHSAHALASYPVTQGAVAGVRALVAAGHQVDAVTGRPASSHRGTEAWLEAAGFGDLPVTYVDKYGRAGCFGQNPDDPPTVSMDELGERRYDAAIDDSPLALDRLADWRSTRVFVFDRPWNADYALAPNMVRASGWRQIVDAFARQAEYCNIEVKLCNVHGSAEMVSY